MTATFVESVAFDALLLILIVSGPVLAAAMIVGLTVSIIQATTQINEMTLTFIPKIVAVYSMIIFAAGFMLEKLVAFTEGIFSDFSRFTL